MKLNKWQEIHQKKWDRKKPPKGYLAPGKAKKKYINKLRGIEEPEFKFPQPTAPVRWDRSVVRYWPESTRLVYDPSGELDRTTTLHVNEYPCTINAEYPGNFERAFERVYETSGYSFVVDGTQIAKINSLSHDYTTIDVGTSATGSLNSFTNEGPIRYFTTWQSDQWVDNTTSDVVIESYFNLDRDSNKWTSLVMPVPLDPAAVKKTEFVHKIKRQLIEHVPQNHLNRTPRADSLRNDFSNITTSEITALGLLKNLLSEAEWRKYLRYGFINVRGKSGLIYQVRRNQNHIIVYKPLGEKLCELCVGGQYQLPPTDKVISKKLIIEANELDIWKKANIYPSHIQTCGMDRTTIQTDQIFALAA